MDIYDSLTAKAAKGDADALADLCAIDYTILQQVSAWPPVSAHARVEIDEIIERDMDLMWRTAKNKLVAPSEKIILEQDAKAHAKDKGLLREFMLNKPFKLIKPALHEGGRPIVYDPCIVNAAFSQASNQYMARERERILRDPIAFGAARVAYHATAADDGLRVLVNERHQPPAPARASADMRLETRMSLLALLMSVDTPDQLPLPALHKALDAWCEAEGHAPLQHSEHEITRAELQILMAIKRNGPAGPPPSAGGEIWRLH